MDEETSKQNIGIQLLQKIGKYTVDRPRKQAQRSSEAYTKHQPSQK